MQRAHLIVNPHARLVTPSLTRAVARVLSEEFSLDISETAFPSDATVAARRAAEARAGLVVAFGGDGLVNEVVNGVAGTGSVLGLVPGGTMNVFARSLGVERDPLQAARGLVDGMRAGAAPSRVDLGCANGRYFTFACGCGFDADVARRVNAHPRTKHWVGELYFYATAVAILGASYAARRPFLDVEGAGVRHRGVMAIVTTDRPYAYLAGRPVWPGGAVPPGEGLHVFVARDLRLRRLPLYALGAVSGSRMGPGTDVVARLRSVRVTSGSTVPAHVDGERLAPSKLVDIEAAPAAVCVLVHG